MTSLKIHKRCAKELIATFGVDKANTPEMIESYAEMGVIIDGEEYQLDADILEREIQRLMK